MNKDFEKYVGKSVWCKTEELAKEFLRLAHDNGWKWMDGESLLDKTYWNNYRENTCYQVWGDKKISYSTTRRLSVGEFIKYEPLCKDKDVSQEGTEEQTFRLSLDDYNYITSLLKDEIEELEQYIEYDYPEEDLAELVNRLNDLVRLYENLKNQKEKTK